MSRLYLPNLSQVRDPQHALVHIITDSDMGLPAEIVAETANELELMEKLNINEDQLGNMLMSILQRKYQGNFDEMVKNGDLVQMVFYNYRNDGTMIYHKHDRKITLLNVEIDEYGSLPKDFTIMDFPVRYWESRIVHNTIINLGPELIDAFGRLTIDQIQQIGYKDFKSTVLDKVDNDLTPDIDQFLEQEGYVFYFVHFLINNKNYYVFAEYYENVDIKEKFLEILKDPDSVFKSQPDERQICIEVDNFIYAPYIE